MMKSLILFLLVTLFISCSKNESNELENNTLIGTYVTKKQKGYRFAAESTLENPIILSEITYNSEGLLTIQRNNSYEVKFLKSSSNFANLSGTFFPKNNLFSVEKYYSSSEEAYLNLNNTYHFENNTLVLEIMADVIIKGQKGKLVVGKLFFDKQ